MLKIISATALAGLLAASALPASAHTWRRHHHRHAAYHTYANCKSAGHKGTAGGAILGALAGQALGHNTTSTVVGAGVGAAAGHNIRYDNCKRRYG